MKLIDNILNNYFSKLLVKKIINSIKNKFDIDICTDTELNIKESNKIIIRAKPKWYENYTLLYICNKKDAFTELLNYKTICVSLNIHIQKLFDTDGWNK